MIATSQIATPRPAATILLVRDSQQGMEVLMQQRHQSAPFGAGAWVFPGGKLEPQDRLACWQQQTDLSPSCAQRQLVTATDARAFYLAAIRETLEEAGVLIAHQASAALAQQGQQFLRQQPDQFFAFCRQHQIQLATSRLLYFSRWVTPEHFPLRFDTRFFLASWPADQVVVQDDGEVFKSQWVSPQSALDNWRQGQWSLLPPTYHSLQKLLAFADAQELLHYYQHGRRLADLGNGHD